MSEQEGSKARGGLAASTGAELAALNVDPASNGLADLALFLARQLDAADDPKTVPGLARQHQAALIEVRRAAAETKPAATLLDQLRQARERRAGNG